MKRSKFSEEQVDAASDLRHCSDLLATGPS